MNSLVNKTIKLLETPDKFITWLNTFPEDSVVGVIASNKYCPIATFLVDKGVNYSVVTTTEIVLYDTEEVHILSYQELPQLGWLTKLIQGIDSLDSLDSLFAKSAQYLDLVTAKQVLAIIT